MASPRLFVSSTCYDLQEIRFQLRQFILDFGYEPVMSEFDDIFYNYENHVQDSCLEEISKCQLFLLVVGNNYGSIYHQEKDSDKIPDSVTLTEFKKALEINIFKHIFINKFVDYDWKNYKRALDKVMLKYFQENNVENSKIQNVKSKLKKEFDETYPFPYDSYRYVFYFLDIINELKDGNAYNTFESFADVKESLKKQWAGFMYESLTRNIKKDDLNLKPLEDKISHIDSNLKKLLESKSTSQGKKISFDISKLSKDVDLENLENLQIKIDEVLKSIFCYETFNMNDGMTYHHKRVWFDKVISEKETTEWLNYLSEIVKNYKWSKFIIYNVVFKNVHLSKYNKNNKEIAHKSIIELDSIFKAFSNEEKKSFIKTVQQKFHDAYEAPVNDDDLPF